jgi:hypothetical protein
MTTELFIAPEFLSAIPHERFREDLARLAPALEAALPTKVVGDNVLIATWNLKEFSSLSQRGLDHCVGTASLQWKMSDHVPLWVEMGG